MKLKYLLSGIAAALLTASTVMAAGTNLVIVEAYGGGGNTGATYKNDFIGLFNRGTTPVDVTGWSVQYASATGTSWTGDALNLGDHSSRRILSNSGNKWNWWHG